MTFLPVVNRELRVAARDWRTYAQRCSVLGVALALGLWLGDLNHQTSNAAFGRNLFGMLIWTAFAVSIIGGLLVTSDAISREKRDGTLGLLFLTDLRAYDIVLGKFTVTSVNILYGVVGIVPLLMFSLLFGGITPWEVGRAALALILCLVFALCCGLLASASSTKSSSAFSYGVGLMLWFMAVFPLAVLAISHGYWDQAPPDWLLAFNPAYALAAANDGDYQSQTLEFWISCCASLSLSLLLFGLACLRTRRAWQERSEGVAQLRFKDRVRQWAYGTAKRRAKVRRRWLNRNPVCWLGRRHLLKSWFALAPLFGALLLWAWALVYQHKYNEKLTAEPVVIMVVAFLLHLMYKLMLASEAGQCFAEDRRVGALEQLAGTALTVREIIRGRLRALFTTFIWAVGVTLIVEWLFFLTSDFRKSHGDTHEMVSTAVVGTLVFIVDLVAIGYLSMWVGLKTRNPVRGTTSAIWRILILPWLCFTVIVTGAHGIDFRAVLTLYAICSLLIDAVTIVMAAYSMKTYLRVMAVNPGLMKMRECRQEAELFRKAGCLEES